MPCRSCDHGFFHKNTSNDFQNSHYTHFPLSTAELVWTLGQTNNALEKFTKLVKQTRILILWRPFAACAHGITSHHHRVWALFCLRRRQFVDPRMRSHPPHPHPLSIKRRRRRKRGLSVLLPHLPSATCRKRALEKISEEKEMGIHPAPPPPQS